MTTGPRSAAQNADRSQRDQEKTARQLVWETNHKANPKSDWEYEQAASASVLAPLHNPEATASAASSASAATDTVLLPGQEVSLDDDNSDSEY